MKAALFGGPCDGQVVDVNVALATEWVHVAVPQEGEAIGPNVMLGDPPIARAPVVARYRLHHTPRRDGHGGFIPERNAVGLPVYRYVSSG